MTNKQVIAVFVAGVALLLAAFWAGLSVIKQDATSDASTANQNAKAGLANQSAGAAATPNTREPPAPESARYVVFVAAFGTLDKAKQLESDLRRKYLAAHVKTPTGNQETLFRVNIGPYDKQDADKVATELATEGRKGIMVLPWTQN